MVLCHTSIFPKSRRYMVCKAGRPSASSLTVQFLMPIEQVMLDIFAMKSSSTLPPHEPEKLPSSCCLMDSRVVNLLPNSRDGSMVPQEATVSTASPQLLTYTT